MAKKSKLERLRSQLDEVEDALDMARLSADHGLVETQKTIAGLTANFWMLRRRIASVVLSDPDCTDKDRSVYKHAELEADKRHHEAQTQFARLADKQKVDLLPKVLARLDEISTDETILQDFAREQAG